jgi:hypothetical protein
MKLKMFVKAAFSFAILMLGMNETARAIVSVDERHRQPVQPGQFSGVVLLEVDLSPRIGIVPFCTGSLLTGGLHILTAAHCLTVGDTNTLASPLLTQPFFASFNLANGVVQVPILDLFVLPGWNGFVGDGNDLAILSLLEPAPVEAEQYDIYRDTNELGQTFTKVGYGNIGNGTEGDRPQQNHLTRPLAHFGQNQFEGTEVDLLNLVSIPPDNLAPGSQLLFDFDSGLSANNLIGTLGLGSTEINMAPGDSGGPSFIGNRIAGITSYGIGCFLFCRAEDGSPTGPGLTFPTDLTQNQTDASFGELSGDSRVSTYASFIDSVLAGHIAPTERNAAAVPAPSTIAGTVAFGLWLLSVCRMPNRNL